MIHNIDIIDGNGIKEEIGLFNSEKFSYNKGFQEFSIEKVCIKVLLTLKHNLGTGGGKWLLLLYVFVI